MYAIKCGEDYLRFGSYSEGTRVTDASKATLYARLLDAQRRAKMHVWLAGVKVDPVNLTLVELEFQVVSEVIV